MKKEYFLALDAGTTSSRSILFDKYGNSISISQKEFTQIYPKKGWVEHNPIEIYETQLFTIKDVMNKGKISASQMNSIGITNQRETTILWNRKTFKPYHNAIVWQCRRTQDICNTIDDCMRARIFQKTGLTVDPYFSATKIKYLIDTIPQIKNDIEKGDCLFGTVDTWLLFMLTDGKVHKTDSSNASRTMLYNITTQEWDKELCEYFGISLQILPQVEDSFGFFGETKRSICGEKIPITAMLGDQQAALFGQACFNEGDTKVTYGTGSFMLMNIGKKIYFSKNKLITTIAWSNKKDCTYALEGSIFTTGAAVQWLRDNLNIIKTADESEKVSQENQTEGNIYFIPSLSGYGAPYWQQSFKGLIYGITRDTTKQHLVKACLEGIVFSVKAVAEAMEKDTNNKITEVKADGGGIANSFIMQKQADLLKTSIILQETSEITALGIAFASALGCGYYSTMTDIKKLYNTKKVYTALPNNVLLKRYENWKMVVENFIPIANKLEVINK